MMSVIENQIQTTRSEVSAVRLQRTQLRAILDMQQAAKGCSQQVCSAECRQPTSYIVVEL